MKAALYEEYGGPEVVRIAEVPIPEPGPDEILIKVLATTVASGDWRMRSAEVPGAFKILTPLIFGRKPKQAVLGTELAGVVARVGNNVNTWKAGDEVFAFPGGSMGAHAEYLCMPANGKVARKPHNISFEQAAALCFGGSTALSFIESAGGVRAGERVLVVGASGSVGTAMVQLAKHFGAHVTGVCSGANAELVRSLGADTVVDYQKTDIRASGQKFDIVCDTVGTLSIKSGRKLLQPGGRLLLVMAGLGDMVHSVFSKRIVAGPAKEDPRHLSMLADLVGQGKYVAPIDEVFPLERIVDAHRRVDTGRKRGNVVVSMPT